MLRAEFLAAADLSQGSLEQCFNEAQTEAVGQGWDERCNQVAEAPTALGELSPWRQECEPEQDHRIQRTQTILIE